MDGERRAPEPLDNQAMAGALFDLSSFRGGILILGGGRCQTLVRQRNNS